MIRIRPWKGSSSAFEVDVIVHSPRGETVRKRVKAPVSGRSNVERWARALEQEVLLQLLDPARMPKKVPPRFGEFAQTFLALCEGDGLGISTRITYEAQLRRYLLPVLAYQRLDKITPSDIAAIKAALVPRSHNTTCEVLKTLRCVLNRAIEQGLIQEIPVAFTIPPRRHRRPVAYNKAQQAALVNAAQELGPEYLALVLLGLDGGLRRGEILGLQWADLDLERAALTVRHNIVRGQLDIPKGRTEDEIGLTRRLTAALEALPRSGPFVFDNSGSHFREHNVKPWFLQILRRAGLPWQGTHILRRTCGTRIADGGGGVAAVATHLRHKSLTTASRYIDRRGATSHAIRTLEDGAPCSS